MARTQPISTAYVAIVPTTDGLRRKIQKDIKGAATPAAKREGQEAGAGFMLGFINSMKSNKPKAADMGLEDLQKAVSDSEKKMSETAEAGAKRREAAQEKVNAAQEKYNRITSAATQDSAEFARAQEAIATAQGKLARAQDALTVNAGKVSLEQRKLAAATEESNKALAEHGPWSDKAAKANIRLTQATARLNSAKESERQNSVRLTKAQENLNAVQEKYKETLEGALPWSESATVASDDLREARERLIRVTEQAAEAENDLQVELDETRAAMALAETAAASFSGRLRKALSPTWARNAARSLGDTFSAASVASMGTAGFASGMAFGSSLQSALSGPAMAGLAGNQLLKLSGLRSIGDMGTQFLDFAKDIDRVAVSLGTAGVQMGSFASIGVTTAGVLLAAGSAFGSMAATALTLPAILTAGGIGAWVFTTAFKDLSTVLPQVVEDYSTLSGVISDSFWDYAAGAFERMANRYFPLISYHLPLISQAFAGWVNSAANTTLYEKNIAMISAVLRNVRTFAVNAGLGIGYLTDALIHITAVGSTFLPRLGTAFTDLMRDFMNWTRLNTDNGNMFRWIETGIQEFKNLGSIISSTVGIFGALYQASLAAGGARGLGGVAVALGNIRAALMSEDWQSALTSLFAGALEGSRYIVSGLTSVAEGFRVLAPAIGESMSLAGESMGSILEYLGRFMAHPAVASGITSFFTSVRDGVTAVSGSITYLAPVFESVAIVAGQLFLAISRIADRLIAAVGPAFTRLAENVRPLVPAISNVVLAIIDGLTPAFQFFAGIAATVVGIVVNAITWLSQFEGLWRGIGLVVGWVAGAILTAIVVIKGIAVVKGIITGITVAWRLLSMAFALSPIGFVITAIIGLIGALVLAYNRIGWFKDFVNLAWSGIKIAAEWAWNGIKQIIGGFVNWLTGTVWPWIQGALSNIGDLFSWLNVNVVQPVWTAIRTAIAIAVAVILTIWDGLVYVGRNVVAPMFLWLYNNIVKPVWDWIAGKISNIITNHIDPAFLMLRAALATLGRKFDEFKNWVGRIWDNLKSRLHSGWLWIDANVFAPVKRGLQWLGEKFDSVKNWVGRIWDSLKSRLHSGWLWIDANVFVHLKRGLQWVGDKFDSVKKWVGRIWDGFTDNLKKGWDVMRDQIFNPIKDGLGKIQDAFGTARDGIERVWNKVQDIVAKPVDFVINTVINGGFIKNFNKVAKTFGIDEIEEIKFDYVNKGLAHGGMVPGYQRKKVDDHLYPVRGGGVQPLRGGEGILVPEATRALGPDFVNTANALGNSGGVGAVRQWVDSGYGQEPRLRSHSHGAEAAGPPGGPNGGIWGAFQTQMMNTGQLNVPSKNVLGVNMGNAAKAWMGRSALDIQINNGSPAVNSGTGSRGTWGFADTAGNLEISPAAPDNRRLGVAIHELGHILSLNHPAGWNNSTSVMSAGMNGGDFPHAGDFAKLASIWGEPGEDVKTYSAEEIGASGGGGNILSGLWSMIGFDRLLENIPGVAFAKDLMVGAAKHIWEGFKSFASRVLNPFDNGGGGADTEVTNIQPVEEWRDEVIAALKREGLPSTLAWQDAWLRQIKSESGGDPNAVQNGYVDANTGGNEAVGLVQVAKSTFDAYRNPDLPYNRKDPNASLSAGMRWAKSRYGVDEMLSVIGHGHGYAEGGILPNIIPKLYDGGGFLYNTGGPQVIDHQRSKPDAVLTAEQWRDMRKIAVAAGDRASVGSSGDTTINVSAPNMDADQIIRRGAEAYNHEVRKAGIR